MTYRKFNSTILISLLITSSFCYGQEWVDTHIAGVGSIKFPAEAEIYDQQGTLVYRVENDDAYYLITLLEINNRYRSGLESNLEEFYEGNIKGVLDVSKGKLIKKEYTTVDGKDAVDFSFKKQKGNNLPPLHFERLVYVNPFVVGLEFLPKTMDEVEFGPLKSKYFNSFQINQNKEVLEVAEVKSFEDSENEAFNVGYILGQMVFYVIVLVVFVGLPLFFIIRRNRKKNDRQKATKSIERIAKTNHKICAECETENKEEAKYCSKCGYTLPK